MVIITATSSIHPSLFQLQTENLSSRAIGPDLTTFVALRRTPPFGRRSRFGRRRVELLLLASVVALMIWAGNEAVGSHKELVDVTKIGGPARLEHVVVIDMPVDLKIELLGARAFKIFDADTKLKRPDSPGNIVCRPTICSAISACSMNSNPFG